MSSLKDKLAAHRAKKISVTGDAERVSSVSELLGADGDTDLLEMVEKAKTDGRYLSLPADSFLPDPNQPRKTFEHIDELRSSIESKGQLQPILVGDRLPSGKYPIIAGERRWRAICESSLVSEVQAIIRAGDVDELYLLLMQIDENNQREQIPAVENAMAMKRVVDICKSEGHDRAYAAKMLNVSPSQLSKHLALIYAPIVVTSLSVYGETQDVEVLYNLAKASEIKPTEVAELIDEWRSGELDTNLRKASKEIAVEAKQAKKEGKAQVDKDAESGSKGAKEPRDNDVPPKPKKASAVRLGFDNDVFMLTVEVGNKKLSFRVEAEAVVSLKGDIDKNWSE
ncbi:ParB/RepB/Spo0J family partition protein [Candidatus Enterovibrio escicola]|uniref:Chromosome (Plasmid) partitioning protein ParB n=1 Tax=Candidatus Enterovibrio escicola TaxID=1927127 RepID=A0A2A5SZB2_9GAMM|nr:ParB/RepB/Spo0J family partition protein [Candidatus Enterovibrio escacola]PCS21198.1 Chromosome (plasmid) partitioning protein ParB [Candidatus Enterovibrio escacola]